MELLNSVLNLVVSIIDFFGKKEVIGILVGVLGTVIWHRITMAINQAEKNKMVLLQIKNNLQQNIEIVTYNIGVVENEQSKLPQKFTLEPLKEFFSPSSDLLVLTSSFDNKSSIELWSCLKNIETLKNKVNFLAAETFVLRRMIKIETRVEISHMELLPYLKQFNGMLLNTLNDIEHECRRALTLTSGLKS